MREAGGAVHAGGLCLSQANKDTGCRMEIKNYSAEKVLRRGTDEETPPPLIRARWLFARLEWILVF